MMRTWSSSLLAPLFVSSLVLQFLGTGQAFLGSSSSASSLVSSTAALRAVRGGGGVVSMKAGGEGEKVAILISGLPGAMGKEVAAACLRR